MHPSNRALLACLAAAATAASAAPAGAPAAKPGAAMFAATGATGMVLAVVERGRVTIDGFGETRPGSGVKPGAGSLLRVGSISKVLAGGVLASLAAQGKLALADPLQRFAPANGVVPAPPGRSVTLLDLATHTSGLPRSVAGNWPDGAAPNTWPDAALRWEWLRAQPPGQPGRAALYSNVGFDLLADALAVAGGKPYTALLRETTTGPLGMPDTTASPGPGQCARLLDGVDKSGPCHATEATAGGGGMYSTAADMGKWLRHLLAAPPAAHPVYLRPHDLASVEGLDYGGPVGGIGLGWIELAGAPGAPRIMQKTGGGGGFMTYLAFAPEHKVGVFVAVTRVDRDMLRALAARVNALVADLAAPAANAGGAQKN